MSAEGCRRYRDEADRPAGARDQEWREHLRECPRCVRQARLDGLLRASYRKLPEPRPSPAFAERLERALESGRGVEVGRRPPAGRSVAGRWAQRLYWAACSGVALALVGRVAAASPTPVTLAIAGGAGLLLGVAVLSVARTLRVSPGLLIARSL